MAERLRTFKAAGAILPPSPTSHDEEILVMANERADGIAIQARFNAQLFDEIENWRRSQPKIPPLATAIRALVVQGLSASSAANNAERSLK